jgi:putative membrane protein
MNRLTTTTVALAVALSGAVFAQNPSPIPAPPVQASVEAGKAADQAPSGSNADIQFYRDALSGGVREITLSRLAMSQSTSVEVNRLASMILNDHGAVDTELRSAGGLAEPRPSAADNTTATELRKMSGALFDRTYLATMERDHLAAIVMFEEASVKAQSSTARDLATAALPKLRQHLLAVQDLQKKMIGS